MVLKKLKLCDIISLISLKWLKTTNMHKIAFVGLTLSLIFAPLGSILAQEAASSTPAVNPAVDLPSLPLDDFFNKFLKGGSLKEAAQDGMNKAQTGLQDAAGQALGTAQDAIKDEINKQADQAVQGARQKAETYIGGVVANVQGVIMTMANKIKIFFVELFQSPAPTT